MKILKISRSAAKNNCDANTLMHGLWAQQGAARWPWTLQCMKWDRETCLLLFSRTSWPSNTKLTHLASRTLGETWYLPKHWHLTSFMYWQNTCKCTFSTSKCIVIGNAPYVIFQVIAEKNITMAKTIFKTFKKKNQKVFWIWPICLISDGRSTFETHTCGSTTSVPDTR